MGKTALMSKIHVTVKRCYRGVDYSLEASPEDFDTVGKVLRQIEAFIDSQKGETETK